MGKQDKISKKTEKKIQEKVIEDKTFGLKNKNKSSTVQKFIKGVHNQVTGNQVSKEKLEGQKFQDKAEKKRAKQEEAFMNSIFKSFNNVKLNMQDSDDEGDMDILCPHFKAGICDKGDKCNYSHDLNLEYNQGNLDIYIDKRDINFEINQIAEEKEKKRSKLVKSNIVCRYFIKAVEKKLYGMKWECPNGDDCQYKHCLPRGYVIRTTKDKVQEEMSVEEYVNLEEQIDEERARISEKGTPVTEQAFREWKKRRQIEKEKDMEEEEKAKPKNLITGIQLFKNQDFKWKDDDNAIETALTKEEDNQDDKTKENVEGVKVNTDLFKDDENLDDLDLDDDENN